MDDNDGINVAERSDCVCDWVVLGDSDLLGVRVDDHCSVADPLDSEMEPLRRLVIRVHVAEVSRDEEDDHVPMV